MKKSAKPRDLSQMAKAIVDQSVSDGPEPDPDEGKDPSAVALGRKGGQKGGKARAAKLTPEERSESARKGGGCKVVTRVVGEQTPTGLSGR